MKFREITTFLFAALVSFHVKAQDVLKYVDPNIGTAHSRWFYFTPAAVPGGMAKLAPSTNGHYGNASGWEAVGYDVRQNSIEGFVHFHEWQVGGVSFMPTTGSLKLNPGELDKPGSGYRSAFSRQNEVAQPGYYKVLLNDYQITAELTATKRVGFHRYTFPKTDQAHIILDIGQTQGESGKVVDSGIHMVDDTHFEGYVITYPKYVAQYDPEGKVAMFVYGQLSRKPETITAFNAGGIQAGSINVSGKGAGFALNYNTSADDILEIKVGLSYTSTANAKANLLAEAAELTFDEAKSLASKTWQQELGKIYVESLNVNDKIKFYTGLFHALLGRGTASDVNGAYPKHGGLSGQLSEQENKYGFMNTDAIWGAFWNVTQLWSLSYPDWYQRFVNTHLRIYKDRGWFGDGIANSQFVSGVGTNFIGLTIAAAYQLGLRDYDVKLAYEAIRKNELGWQNRPKGSGKMDTRAFLKFNYVPQVGDGKNFISDSTGSSFSASHTLEYSFSAFAAAQMAKSLGNDADYKMFMGYSNGWRKLFNPANKLIQPKTATGEFIKDFDPYEAWRGFQEGNAKQYTYYVPHNPAALIGEVGNGQFNETLDGIFKDAEKKGFGGGKTIDAFAGINAVYNHGNQPSLHISWLFNFSRQPWLTQKWTRMICDQFYGTEPIHGYGYGQDEDQGQLGSWYVLTSLGLFDVKGFTDLRPIIEFGSPAFDKASITLGNKKILVIETKNNSKEHVYVQNLTFNGRNIQNCWLYRDELMKGGKLVFTMGSEPNKNWGTSAPPPSAQ
ncbi:MAG: GH92 family glycosyl hydrolase [Dyadobacter sp.]|uniref:GH92 family glycosyl hydrolase n=1 Tax=Dyadobacter sp. TaxID=1914288 RepID=UPI0032670957